MLTRSAVAALLSLSICAQAATVTVTDAWIAEGPAAVPVNAAYMKINNDGLQSITLVAIESPAYPQTEIHQSMTINGVAGMEHVHHIDIAPGTMIELAPGDLHLMLYNNGRPPQDGDTIPLILRFADGTTSHTEAVVRKMSDSHQHQHQIRETTVSPEIMSRLRVFYQHLLPQHMLSGLMYRVTRMTWPPLKNRLIRSFIRLYEVDMSIAVNPEPDHYLHFNEFFTRPLKPEARPVDPAADAIVSPVDGAVSQYGRINEGRMLQAKGRLFTATELLGGDAALGSVFRNGDFITLYLSPRDYHRIHMPVRGTLSSMTYVPGDLYSVSPSTTQGIDNLFARNERVIQVFDTDLGKVALVMVGAIFVGSMETVWAGEITPAPVRQTYTISYNNPDKRVHLGKGAEMGRFNMGSTVILLFEQDRLQWEDFIRPDQSVRLGQRLAVSTRLHQGH